MFVNHHNPKRAFYGLLNMLQTDLTFDYAYRKNAPQNASLLLLLHGYGSDERDLFHFAARLPAHYFVASIRAPHILPFGGYAWYALTVDAAGKTKFDDAQALESHRGLSKLIDELRVKHELSDERVVLVGFSQGAAMGYGLALSHPQKIGKIAAMSGYLTPDFIPNPPKDCVDLRVFISHGTADAVVPFHLALQACELLQGIGIKPELKRYEHMGHNIGAASFADMLRFLKTA